MEDTSTWSEEGQALAAKFGSFRFWAWVFLGANAGTIAAYLFMWSVLLRKHFYLDWLFLLGANRAWLIPVAAAVPVAIVGLGWMSAAFRAMADPADEEAFSGEKIAFGFVFPGISFVRPQQILSALHRKSCRFAEVREDPAVANKIAIWVAVFWGGRLMDIFRTVARNRLEDYGDFFYVALFATAACALNIAFVLMTMDLFGKVLAVQGVLLKDPAAYDRKYRQMTLGTEPLVAEAPVSPKLEAEPMGSPTPRERVVRDDANPFSIQGRKEDSYLDPRHGQGRGERLEWSDILFSSNGRLSRGTFVKYSLLIWLGEIAGWGLVVLLMQVWAGFGLLLLGLFPLAFAHLMLQVKRWHDHGKSGWMVLVGLIPLLGAVYSVVMLFFLVGDENRNGYGAPEHGGSMHLDEDAQAELDFYSKL